MVSAATEGPLKSSLKGKALLYSLLCRSRDCDPREQRPLRRTAAPCGWAQAAKETTLTEKAEARFVLFRRLTGDMQKRARPDGRARQPVKEATLHRSEVASCSR